MHTGETLLQGTAALADKTPLWNLMDGSKKVQDGEAVITFYYRESFGLWKHGWMLREDGIWRVAREHLTLLGCEKIKKPPATTLREPHPAPSPAAGQQDQPDEDMVAIFKAFMRLNQVR